MPQWYPESHVPDGDAAVSVTDLTISMPDGRLLLEDAVLEVRPGRVTALTGPSGCGKTTLLRAVAGALPPEAVRTQGTVRVLGRDVLALPGPELRTLRRRHLAFVGQDPGSGLNPRMKVRRLLSEVAVDRSPGAVEALLTEVRLPTGDGLAARRPGGLSGGQQRRVALARALARRPAVLLLDEPTAGLDPALRDEIAQLLRHLAVNHRLAVALSCHDADLVARLADVVADLSVPRRAPASAMPAPVAVRDPAGEPGAVGQPGGPGGLGGSGASWNAGRRQAEPASPVVSVTGLHAAFSRHGRRAPVLHGIDLALAMGSRLGIVGASGSGKTTLLRSIVGLHRPTAGTVRLDGVRLSPSAHRRTREQRRRIQLVPQDPLGTLNPSRTIGAAIRRPLLLHRRADRGRAPERVRELLRQVGLPAAFADRYPHELSGGQRQRASIARALAADPDVLVCDEVTSALDETTATAVMDLLDELRGRRGLSLVLVSHDLRLIAHRTDTMLELSAGRAVRSGPTGQLLTSATAAGTSGV